VNLPEDEHRQLRLLLGSYVLGGLDEQAAVPVLAHLDGCPSCRAELAEIAPLADDLRRVDLTRLEDVPSPPAGLGERIREQVVEERLLVDARRARDARRAARRASRRRGLVAAAAAGVALAVLGAGSVLGRVTAPAVTALPTPSASSTAPIPLETVPVQAFDGVDVDSGVADVIAHTWGVEAVIVATGFRPGQTYRAAFRSSDGALLPAGEFLGTGDKPLRCNLQAALLRPDTEGFVVMDDAGEVVLSGDLPAAS
jgi:hypothetical protein